MKEKILKLSGDLKNEILSDLGDFCRIVRKTEPEEALTFISSERYLRSQADYYISIMEKNCSSMVGKRILEVGSGYGFFLVYGIKELGWDLYGIEPGLGDRFEIALKILNENGVEQGRLIDSLGEDIKFESNSFDIVISNDVLEHVINPERVIQEAYRILKPGGKLIFNMPNYRWFYEGHYNILWFPFISKPFAKKYVRLIRRDPYYLDSLHFITPSRIKRLVKDMGQKFYLPLNYLSTESMLERAKAYIECMNGDNGRYILDFVYTIASCRLFKFLMDILATVTGIHHEIHLVIMKDKNSI